MGRPTGLEPPTSTEAKSLEFMDLVECYILGSVNKKQEVACWGREMRGLGQLPGNLDTWRFNWPHYLRALAATFWGRLRPGLKGI